MANCVEEVLAAFPDADRKDIQILHDAMSKERRDAFIKAGANPDAEFMKKSMLMLERYRKGVEINKTKVLQNIAKRKQVEEFVANPIFKDKAEGLRAMMAGTFKNVKEGRLSVDYRSKANEDMLLHGIISDLDQHDGLLDIFKSGALDREIMVEVHNLALNQKSGKPVTSISGSSEAFEIGKALHKNNQMKLRMANDAGAFVNDLEGFIMTRSYDADSMRAKGKEAFVNFMLENVDFDKSFKKDFFTLNGKEVIEGIWKDVVEDGKTGMVHDAGDADKVIGIINSPVNMARMMERGRTIHFKNPAEGEFNFMKEFGKRTLNEEVISSIRRTAKNAALMSTLGTNPKATFQRLIADLDPAAQKRMMNYMAEADGSTGIPGHSPAAKRLADVRRVIDITSLGTAVLSSLPDLATRAGTMQASGDNFFSAMADSLGSFMKNMSRENRQEMLHLTSIGTEARVGDILDRFSSGDSSPGMISKLHQKYFKVNGLKWWTDVNTAGNAQTLAAGLGMRSHQSFAELKPEFSRVVSKYGIGPVEWDVIRHAAEDADGVKMIGFASIKDLDNGVVEKILRSGGMIPEGVKPGPFVDRFKRDTSAKLATYFKDRSDIAMNVAGMRERAEVLRRGTFEDTPEGQLFRFMGQFKSYSVTMVTKFMDMYRHEALDGKSLAQRATTIAPLMVSMTALGYLGMVAKDLVKGKSPKDPKHPAVWVEAMARGGVGGIYGDYLLGEFDSRHGRSALSSMVGPAFGKIDDTFDLFNQLKQAGLEANPDKVRASAMLRYVTNIIPGNFPVVRQALDYLFLNEMAESLNPGYNARMKSRMAKLGQEPILDGEGEF